MLENRFAGPRPSSVATSFGTLIHAVAQQGSEEGLDHLSHNAQALATLGLDSTAGTERRIELSRHGLMPSIRANALIRMTIADTRNRYEATRKDESAADALRNIADYFVRSDADPETYLARTPATSALAHWPVPNANGSLPHVSMCVTYSTHTMPCPACTRSIGTRWFV